MKKTFSFLAVLLISTGVLAQEKPVKMSNSEICDSPYMTYYELTMKYTPFKTLDECLTVGGRMPKK